MSQEKWRSLVGRLAAAEARVKELEAEVITRKNDYADLLAENTEHQTAAFNANAERDRCLDTIATHNQGEEAE